MSAVDRLFADFRSRGQKALMPFVTAGDPDLDFTGSILRELVVRGAHLFELGIPYSDPIADGPVVQASYTRALAKHIKLHDIFETIGRTAPSLGAPVVTMTSYAIVHRHGLEKYVGDAQSAGIAGTIVPDLPVEEAEALAKVCRGRDFSLIQLVTPTTPRERAVRIAASTSGFIYYVSVTGITGERTTLPEELVENVAWLRRQTPLPVCIGFGISRPEHVRLLAPVADGLIVGSAIVKRIAAAESRPREQVIREVGDYVTTLLEAMQ
jgi:tryptophan synthase alpha chain